MRNSLFAAGAAALLILPVNAFAACATSASNAEIQTNNKVVQEIVDNTQVDPETGDVEGSTGAAKPEENWLGCPADSDEQSCQTPEGQDEMRKQAEAKTSKSDSGEDGIIHAQSDVQAKVTPSADQDCADDKIKTAG